MQEPPQDGNSSRRRRGVIVRVAVVITGLAVGAAAGVVPLSALVVGSVGSAFVLAVAFDNPLALRMIHAHRRRAEMARVREPVLSGWKLWAAAAVAWVVLSIVFINL